MRPTKAEIREYRDLHNADEVGLNDRWTLRDAEYWLLLDDKYYYWNKREENYQRTLDHYENGESVEFLGDLQRYSKQELIEFVIYAKRQGFVSDGFLRNCIDTLKSLD